MFIAINKAENSRNIPFFPFIRIIKLLCKPIVMEA